MKRIKRIKRIKTEGVLTYPGSWIILQCDLETTMYYQWWLAHHGIKVNLPIWKSHISVVRGEDLPNPAPWGRYEGNKVDFSYQISDIWWNGSYWWINIRSSRLEEIRSELGLDPQPKYKFHWTIGKEYERRLGCRFGSQCYRE